MPKITRFEVIDETGRFYSRWGVDIDLSYQDDGRTLKVFVKQKPPCTICAGIQEDGVCQACGRYLKGPPIGG